MMNETTGCYLVYETEGQPPGTQKDLEQANMRVNEKLANPHGSKRLSPTLKKLYHVY